MQKNMISLVGAAAVAVVTLGAAMAPAQAAPFQTYHQSSHHQKPRFERHGTYAYYNGHKGYKTRHAGYRYYDGYWFPPAAFIIGGIIGSIIGNIATHR